MRITFNRLSWYLKGKIQYRDKGPCMGRRPKASQQAQLRAGHRPGQEAIVNKDEEYVRKFDCYWIFVNATKERNALTVCKVERALKFIEIAIIGPVKPSNLLTVPLLLLQIPPVCQFWQLVLVHRIFWEVQSQWSTILTHKGEFHSL